MFKKTNFLILSISRGEITLFETNVSEKTSTKKVSKEWNPENPEETRAVIEEITKTAENNKLRILLKEDIYYLVKLPYSENTERKEVLKIVSEKVPEKLDEYSWDYKEIEEIREEAKENKEGDKGEVIEESGGKEKAGKG